MLTMTLSDVLNKGIQREIESQQLYSDLERRVKESAAKYAFEILVKEEHRHQQILEQYLKGGLTKGALDIKQVVDYRIAEHLQQPGIRPEMTLPEIFMLAANREKESNQFYLGLASIHPAGETKQLLEKLASEELGHKSKVESLYTQVAFPQTDGG
jgi:rubrerythrin